MKVLIAIPSTGYIPAQTVSSLLELNTPPHTKHTILIGALIYEARERLAESALAEGYTHILWLDSDITFPQDTLYKLLKCDADIACGLVYRRVAPYTPLIFRKQDNGLYREILNYLQNRIIDIDACGFGCVLTKVDAISKMYECYDKLFAPDNLGEDLQFCERAKDMGLNIVCDTSVKCGHLGQILITETQFEVARDALERVLAKYPQ